MGCERPNICYALQTKNTRQVIFIMGEVNILATLFSNPGLLHVAEHVISFLDDKSAGQYRLVSKKSCEFLNNIWRDRMLRTAKQLCKKKFEVYEWRPVVQMDRNEMG